MKAKIFLLSILLAASQVLFAQTTPPPAGKTVPASQHYEGGQDAMYKFINDNVVYPPVAKRSKIAGEVKVSVTIEANGNLVSAKTTTNLGGGLEVEALRVVKLLKFKSPGYRFETIIPVYFKL